jgi:Ca-activated chloride channel homolog
MFRILNWYFLFLIIPVLYLFFIKKKHSSIKFSNINIIKNSIKKGNFKSKIGKIFIFLSVLMFIIALARPQSIKNFNIAKKKGIDIAIAFDVSKSMMEEDFAPNRLEAGKRVIENFIDGRKNDRIGFVIFSGTAYTKIPLTNDYNAIKQIIRRVSYKDVSSNGTAIGMGVAVSVNRLKNSSAKSKIMILVTDGENNAGTIAPETAAILAKELGVKIYTIGVGSDSEAVRDFFGNISYRKRNDGPDEELLKKISIETGGKYFRATDEKALADIFTTIDKMEKSNIDTKNYIEYKELFSIFIKIGLIFLILGVILEKYIFIRIP